MPYGNSARTKRIWKVATAVAKKAGYSSFKKGTPGDAERKKIAEKIDAKGGVKKRRRRK